MKMKSGIVSLIALLFLQSCVVTKAEGEQMMADISRLKGEISTLQREKSDFAIVVDKKYDRILSRVTALETKTYKKATSETQESEQLRRELEQLRGELEEAQNKFATKSDSPSEKALSREEIPDNKKEHFLWAKQSFDDGEFETAIMRADSFIEKYRDEKTFGSKVFLLKGDAAVMLAKKSANEAAKKDFYKKAVTSYQDLLTRFPKSEEIPEGLYKVGETLEAMGFKKDAKIFFEEIKTKHAKTPFGKKAIKKLASASKNNKNS